MNRGRAVILHPDRLDSVRRHEFLLRSLRSSGLVAHETVEESRIVIEWEGEPVAERARPARKRDLVPEPVKVERAMRERFKCDPDEREYWDEMIRLTAERQGLAARRIEVDARTGGKFETWGLAVGDHLAVNRDGEAWAVTHIGTGKRAAARSKFYEALALARAVAEWPEWATLRDPAQITPEFRAKARAAFGEVAA